MELEVGASKYHIVRDIPNLWPILHVDLQALRDCLRLDAGNFLRRNDVIVTGKVLAAVTAFDTRVKEGQENASLQQRVNIEDPRHQTHWSVV